MAAGTSAIACRYPTCPLIFNSQASMLQHYINSSHTPPAAAGFITHIEQPNAETAAADLTQFHPCDLCPRFFKSAGGLHDHLRALHLTAPISEVPELVHDEATWHVVEGRFCVAWTNPTIKLYKVHRIFKVYNPGWRRKDFEDYRKELKRQMSEPKMVKEDIPHELCNRIQSNGNELYRYHGTTVKCKLGRPAAKVNGAEQEALSLCSDTECSLCRILETGFMKDKCRINSFQRYGKGIYCSGSSSKASAYVKCTVSVEKQGILGFFSICFGNDDYSSSKVNHKVMIVCRVLAGRTYHTTHNLRHLKGPPDGFQTQL